MDISKLNDDTISKISNFINNMRDGNNYCPLELADFLKELTGIEYISIKYTNNTDYSLFGIIVAPTLEKDTISSILYGISQGVNDTFEYSGLRIEIDSKVFNLLTDDEIAAVLLYNIISICDDDTKMELQRVIFRYLVDSNIILRPTEIQLYEFILKLAFVDTLIKLSNCMYCRRPYFSEFTDIKSDFDSSMTKLFNDVNGMTNVELNNPKLYIFEWCINIYNNIKSNRLPAINVLKRSKEVTGSCIYRSLFDDTINALYRIDEDNVFSESTSLLEGKGLFSKMKYNGMRGIEDDFYEFMVRARNAETEEDVMYALKQINARLTIISDYIASEDLDPSEKERWSALYIKYCNIRDEIANKKIYNKKNYGIFFDYNKLYDDEE